MCLHLEQKVRSSTDKQKKNPRIALIASSTVCRSIFSQAFFYRFYWL
jgi:hypothetical protein